MGTLVPLLEHRWDTTFAPALSPRPVPAAMSPAPAWSPEEEPESQEDDEKSEQGSKTAKTIPKAKGTMERHSIAIVWIRQRRRLARGGLDRDRRSLSNACLEGKECDARHRGDQDQRRKDP